MLIDDDSADDEAFENDTAKDDGEPYAPEDYDTTDTSPWISTATFLESPTDDVSLNCGGEPEALPDGAGPTYAVAETHTDGAAVTVSNVEVESEGETVVPDAHYTVGIEGVETTGGSVIFSNVYDEKSLKEGADASLWRGAAVGEDYGFFLEMPRVESTSTYLDVVTEDGEIHRYIVKICRKDV